MWSVARADSHPSRLSSAYLDVRTAEEFANGHAPGAVNAPLMFASASGMTPNAGFLTAAAALAPDKAAQLLVGCKSGVRSLKASSALTEAGYTSVIDVAGGWTAWEAAGLPVEK
jgi:rhodanese-related sulfurtransferase